MLSAEDTEINKAAALKQLTLVKETFKKTTTKYCDGDKCSKGSEIISQRLCGKANESGA